MENGNIPDNCKLVDWAPHIFKALLFFNNFIEVQFTYHKIHPFKVCNSMFFGLCTNRYNHHQLLSEHFITLKKKPIPISYPSLNPHPQIPKQPTTNLLSVSLDFPIWDISHEWNHIICNFLNWHLSLSTMFSKFHGSCCSVYQYFISLHDLIICQC